MPRGTIHLWRLHPRHRVPGNLTHPQNGKAKVLSVVSIFSSYFLGWDLAISDLRVSVRSFERSTASRSTFMRIWFPSSRCGRRRQPQPFHRPRNRSAIRTRARITFEAPRHSAAARQKIHHAAHARPSQDLPEGLTLGNEFEDFGSEVSYLLISKTRPTDLLFFGGNLLRHAPIMHTEKLILANASTRLRR